MLQIGKKSYLDHIPLHPHPFPLQSQSNYLARILELNGSATIYRFRRFLDSPLVDTYLADFPLEKNSLARLSIALDCSIDKLLATSFYFFLGKFGRKFTGPGQKRFLKGSLAEYIRYCPDCLRVRPYFVLPWRFLPLQTCPEHKCQLLDQCEHCGQKIPINTHIIPTTLCPLCNKNLSACKSSNMEDADLAYAEKLFDDLTYLLEPQGFEEHTTFFEYLTTRLHELEKEKGISFREATRLVNGDTSFIDDHPMYNVIPFLYYVQFSKIMGFSLRDLFTPIYEQSSVKFLTKMDQVHDHLSLADPRTIYQQIIDFCEIPKRRFWQSGHVYRRIQEIVIDYLVYDQDLIAEIDKAHKTLPTTNNRLGYRQVAGFIGVSKDYLKQRQENAKRSNVYFTVCVPNSSGFAVEEDDIL